MHFPCAAEPQTLSLPLKDRISCSNSDSGEAVPMSKHGHGDFCLFLAVVSAVNGANQCEVYELRQSHRKKHLGGGGAGESQQSSSQHPENNGDDLSAVNQNC